MDARTSAVLLVVGAVRDHPEGERRVPDRDIGQVRVMRAERIDLVAEMEVEPDFEMAISP